MPTSESPLLVIDAQGQDTIGLDGATADIRAGGHGQPGDLFVNDSQGKPTIHLDGATGEVILQGVTIQSLLQRITLLEDELAKMGAAVVGMSESLDSLEQRVAALESQQR